LAASASAWWADGNEEQRAGKGTDKVGRGGVSVKFLRAVGGGRIITDSRCQGRIRAENSKFLGSQDSGVGITFTFDGQVWVEGIFLVRLRHSWVTPHQLGPLRPHPPPNLRTWSEDQGRMRSADLLRPTHRHPTDRTHKLSPRKDTASGCRHSPAAPLRSHHVCV
jgi:hypothetical protein